jgi:hypothetical protein
MPCRHPGDKTVPKIVPTSPKHRRLRHSVPPIGRGASLYANLVNIVRGLRWLRVQGIRDGSPGKEQSKIIRSVASVPITIILRPMHEHYLVAVYGTNYSKPARQVQVVCHHRGPSVGRVF